MLSFPICHKSSRKELLLGDAYGIRTRVPAVRGLRPTKGKLLCCQDLGVSKNSWPKITKTKNHGKDVYLVDSRIAGKGERKFFATKAQADGFAQSCRVRRENEGGSAFNDRELALHGWTVARAIQFALDHLNRQAKSVPVAEAIDKLISAKAASGRQEDYCDDLRRRLTRFTDRHLYLTDLLASGSQSQIRQIETAQYLCHKKMLKSWYGEVRSRSQLNRPACCKTFTIGKCRGQEPRQMVSLQTWNFRIRTYLPEIDEFAEDEEVLLKLYEPM